ncbi:MAG: photosynthetic reaction center cytochrome PufC [Devosia sp.]
MTFRFGYTEAAVLVVSAFLVLAIVFLPGYDRPPIETVQNGFRGTAMAQIYNPRTVAATYANNQVPEIEGLPPLVTAGPTAADSYQNIQVLGDLSTAQFLRLMTAITAWVSPEQGCNYCHDAQAGFADDSVYAKRVSRWMIQMTRTINNEWTDHVATGVSCYTCHRGNNVPEYVWYDDPTLADTMGMAGYRAGQNRPADAPLLASLPADPFGAHLSVVGDNDIRVQSLTALPTGNNPATIQDTELTYSLMMHMSGALGVNCTYCHNSQNWSSWAESTPQRTTAWYGIQMVKALNSLYIVPSAVALPEHRLGPSGDPAKVNCATCHQGVYKPLFGANMTEDWPSLTAANTTTRETLLPGLGDVDASMQIGAEMKSARATPATDDAADEPAATPEETAPADDAAAPADATPAPADEATTDEAAPADAAPVDATPAEDAAAPTDAAPAQSTPTEAAPDDNAAADNATDTAAAPATETTDEAAPAATTPAADAAPAAPAEDAATPVDAAPDDNAAADASTDTATAPASDTTDEAAPDAATPAADAAPAAPAEDAAADAPATDTAAAPATETADPATPAEPAADAATDAQPAADTADAAAPAENAATTDATETTTSN